MQGSAIGPAAFTVAASDLQPITNGNFILKFADDTYLIIPACQSSTCIDEIKNIEEWAESNNLKLNRSKSKELIIHAPRQKGNVTRDGSAPLEISGIHRVLSMTCLGVQINHNLSFSEHISEVIGKCQQSLFALKILRAHGLPEDALHTVFCATTLSKLTYASPD